MKEPYDIAIAALTRIVRLTKGKGQQTALDALKAIAKANGGTDFKQAVTISTAHSFSMYFDWSQHTVGFGQFSASFKNGKYSTDTEGMGREWSRRAMYALVDKVCDEAFDADGRPRD